MINEIFAQQMAMHFLFPYLNTIMVEWFVVALLITYYLFQRWNPKAKLAPEPKGAWPIIGHLPMLARSSRPHRTLGALADKHGPLFTIWLGLHRVLVVNNWETAKECFTTNDAEVSSRPKLVSTKHLGYNQAMLGFAPHGRYWREIRKLTATQLLSNRRLEVLKHIRVSEMNIFLERLYRIWSEKKNAMGQVLVDMNEVLGGLTLNVILRMLVGKRYSVDTDQVEDHETEPRLRLKAMREFFHLAGLFVAGDAVPCLGWLDFGGYEKTMKRTVKQLDGILGKWLQEHKIRRQLVDDDDQVNKNEQDLMDVMLSVLDQNSKLEGYDADTIIQATISNLIGGGSDTTIITLVWAISLLLNNPHTLKKAQEELDAHVGHERVVDESDISKLVYLQAIVKETLRLYPPAPLSAPREFSKDCTIGGYHIPKGTRLITNIWKIQTDSDMWEDPLKFKPERFLTTKKDVDVKGHHFELIPFGSGRRSCPGMSFGLQMLHFTLATFLHAFDITTPSNDSIDMIEKFGLTNTKDNPLEILITPRLPAKLYGQKEHHLQYDNVIKEV